MKKEFTPEEITKIKTLYPFKTHKEIADIINRPHSSVKKKILKLGLQKRDCKYWTELERAKLSILYRNNNTDILSRVFRTTPSSVYKQAGKLGLQKDKEFKSSQAREQMTGNTHGKNLKHSEEYKKRKSEEMKGNQHAVGSKHSEQTKKVISQKVKEFRAKPETKQRYREWWNSLTEEEKEHVTGRSVEAMKAFWDNMTTEEKSDFVKPRREKANKARLEQWAALTTEEKEIKMKNIRMGWNDWYNNLSKKEKEEHITPARIAASQTSPTSIEIAVQEILDILNIEYEAQKPIGKYIADFYIPAQNLIIECDGDYWHSLPDVKKRDKQKDKYLRKQGYTVKRLPEKVIKNDKHAAVKQALGS